MRLPVLLVLALGLAGCSNRVISYEPLFTRDRAAEASILPGVWAAPTPGCRFDPNRPIQDWPACANPSLIDRRDFSRREFLSGGEPMIVQSRYGKRGERPHYAYMAFQAASRDNRGRVNGLELWFVECGPPHITGEGDKQERGVTRTPLRGLKIEGDNCVATTAEAVRNAARESRSWLVPLPLNWVRKRSLFDRKPDSSGWSVDPQAARKVEEAPAAPAVDLPR